jgi:flagella basal body P-ring formation protein FlgA
MALAALNTLILAHYSLEGELQLDFTRPWVDPTPSTVPLSLVVVEFPKQVSSTLLLKVKIESSQLSSAEFPVVLRAQLWREAWSTRQPVARDEVFDSSRLELRKIDLLRERDVLPANAGDGSYAYSHPVPAGRLLSWRDLAPRSLVRKGELIEVAAVDGPISVCMKAVALQNGAVGETISVRNPDSKKEISAQVVGEKRVVVRF